MAADIHINLDPASKTATLRHLGRIQRLRVALTKTKYSSNRQNFQDEIDRRILTLKARDIVVPTTDIGLRDLISQVSSRA